MLGTPLLVVITVACFWQCNSPTLIEACSAADIRGRHVEFVSQHACSTLPYTECVRFFAGDGSACAHQPQGKENHQQEGGTESGHAPEIVKVGVSSKVCPSRAALKPHLWLWLSVCTTPHKNYVTLEPDLADSCASCIILSFGSSLC